MKISSIIVVIGAVAVVGAVLLIIILGEGTFIGGETVAEILAKARNLDNLSYTEILTAEGLAFEAKVWVLGQKTKRETTTGGKTSVMIVDSGKKEYITYVPGEKIATRMPLGGGEQQKTPPEEVKDVPETTVERLKDETLGEKSCAVVEYTQETGITTLWLWKDNGLPIKMEIMASGKKTVKEYKDIKIGEVKESDFDLPAGVKIQEFEVPEIPEMPEIPEIEIPGVE